MLKKKKKETNIISALLGIYREVQTHQDLQARAVNRQLDECPICYLMHKEINATYVTAQ